MNDEDQVALIIAKAKSRMEACEDPQILGLRPTERDWMTKEEAKELHRLELIIVEKQETTEEICERVKRKREARKAKMLSSKIVKICRECDKRMVESDIPIFVCAYCNSRDLRIDRESRWGEK